MVIMNLFAQPLERNTSAETVSTKITHLNFFTYFRPKKNRVKFKEANGNRLRQIFGIFMVKACELIC